MLGDYKRAVFSFLIVSFDTIRQRRIQSHRFILGNTGLYKTILDDHKARKTAQLLGHIPSIKPIIDKIRQTNFRLSTEIEFEALRQAGEY